MWDAFRRNAWYFTKIVDSHNAKVAAMRYDSYDQNEYYKDYEKSINEISDNICYVNLNFLKSQLQCISQWLCK